VAAQTLARRVRPFALQTSATELADLVDLAKRVAVEVDARRFRHSTQQQLDSTRAPAQRLPFEQLDKVGLAQRSLLLRRHPVGFERQPCERCVGKLDAASVAPAFDRAATDTGLRCSLRNRAASREHVGCCSDRVGVRASHY
jgi:hypothetical protein